MDALRGELLCDTHGDILDRNDIRQIAMMMQRAHIC
ncbi:unnamed protein product, partial [Rotaria magnacalcarata]